MANEQKIRMIHPEDELRRRRKYCKDCDLIKEIHCFYKAGPSYQSRCKPCHIVHRKVNRRIQIAKKPPKKNPFESLPQETQDGILKYWDTMPKSTLARKFDIKPMTFYGWIRRGHLPID